MSKNLPIDRIDGVPEQLIEQINDRLRRITSTVAASTIPAKDGKRGSTGAPGPAGPPGAGSGPAPLPPVLVSGDVAIVQRWDKQGNKYGLGYDLTITPSEGADTPKIALIRITRTGPGSSTEPRLELTLLPGPFADGVPVTYSSEAFPYDLNLGALDYWLEFQTLNTDLVEAATAPLSVQVTATPLTFSQVTSAAELQRYNDDAITRGLKVDVDVVVRVVDNPGAGLCTKWLDRDDGNGNQWCGWEELSGNGDIHVSILNQPPGLVAKTWTITCAPGAIEEFDPIPATAVTLTYTQAGPAVLSSTVATGARFGAINYSPVGGGLYGFSWDHIPLIVDIANPDLWFLRFTAQDCDVSGNPAPDDRGLERNAFDVPGKIGDKNVRWTWSGTALDILPLAINAIWGPVRTDAYNYTKVRVYAVSRAGSDDGTKTLQACWTGTEPADCRNAADHKSADIIQDVTKGVVTIPTNPAAPPVLAATATINTTTIGGVGMWNASGLVTVDIGNANFSHDRQLHISLPGFAGLVIPGPFTLIGGGSNQVAYTTPWEPQAGSITSITLAYGMENEDGAINFGTITQTKSIPAGTPVGGTAPAPPVIVTAAATVHYQKIGHDWLNYPDGSFLAPADPSAALKYVRVALLNAASGDLGEIVIPGPFTPGTTYTFANIPPVPIPASPQTWHVVFTPVNANGEISTPTSVAITVTPNVVTAVNGSENSALRYTDNNGGANTVIPIAPVLSITNAPGYAQTLSLYLSKDSGSTWYWKGWQDMAAPGQTLPISEFRPTDADKTCKVAVAIGAWPGPEVPNAPVSLPANAVQMVGTFNLPRIGAPLTTGVTNAHVITRTAIAPYLWNDVVLQKSVDGVVWWGLPDGIAWDMPAPTTDQNLWGVQLTVQYVDISGNPVTSDQDGVEKPIQDTSGQGTFTCLLINYYRFPPVGSTAVKARFRLRGFSRSAGATGWKDSTFSVILAAWPGSASFFDVTFGAAPPSSIVAGLSAASVAAPLYVDPGTGKLNDGGALNPNNMLANAGFDIGTLGQLPTTWEIAAGQIGTVGQANSPTYNSPASCQFQGSHSAIVQFKDCRPGDYFYVEAYVYVGAGDGNGRVLLSWNAAGGIFLSNTIVDISSSGIGSVSGSPLPLEWSVTSTGTGFFLVKFTAAAPVSACQFRFYVGCNSNTSGSWFFDGCLLQRAVSGSPGGPVVLGTLDGSRLSTATLGSDLTKFNGATRPIVVVFGLPLSIGFGTAYPQGAIVFDTSAEFGVGTPATNTAAGTFFKNMTGSKWEPLMRPSDLVAGTIAAGVGYIGSLSANQVNAGILSGIIVSAVNILASTFQLNLNNCLTTIANLFDSGGAGGGSNVGMKVQDLLNSMYSTVSARGHSINRFDGLSLGALQSNGTGAPAFGSLVLSDPSNSSIASVNPQSGVLLSASGGVGHGTVTIGFVGGVPTITLTDTSTGNSITISPTGISRNGLPYNFP